MWLVDGERAFYTFADCREALNAGGGYAEKTWIESGAVQTIQAILEPGGGYAHIAADHSPLPLRSSVMGLGSFWIDVPTPFQKGDLLRGNDRELCILLDDERWHMTEEERRDREINGCFLDMCVLVAPVGDGSGKVGDLLAEPCPYLMLDYPDRRAEQRN